MIHCQRHTEPVFVDGEYAGEIVMMEYPDRRGTRYFAHPKGGKTVRTNKSAAVALIRKAHREQRSTRRFA